MARQSTDYIKPTCPAIDRIASRYSDEIGNLLDRMVEDFKEYGTIPMRDAFDKALVDSQQEIKDLSDENQQLSQQVSNLQFDITLLREEIAGLRAELEAVYE